MHRILDFSGPPPDAFLLRVKVPIFPNQALTFIWETEQDYEINQHFNSITSKIKFSVKESKVLTPRLQEISAYSNPTIRALRFWDHDLSWQFNNLSSLGTRFSCHKAQSQVATWFTVMLVYHIDYYCSISHKQDARRGPWLNQPPNSVTEGQSPRTTFGTDSVSVMVLRKVETIPIIRMSKDLQKCNFLSKAFS